MGNLGGKVVPTLAPLTFRLALPNLTRIPTTLLQCLTTAHRGEDYVVNTKDRNESYRCALLKINLAVSNSLDIPTFTTRSHFASTTNCASHQLNLTQDGSNQPPPKNNFKAKQSRYFFYIACPASHIRTDQMHTGL